MKFDNAEGQGETVISQNEGGAMIDQDKEAVHFHCRNCAMPMISTKENAVQCEILKDDNPKNLLQVNNSRRGSAHSITEIREDVAFDDGVSTAEDLPQAPDEIILVTRSFENEVQPPPPRRSSISQFLTNIKSLGKRQRSEPDLKKTFHEEDDAEMPRGLRGGVRRHSTCPNGLYVLNETNYEDESRYNSSEDLGPRGPQLKRHSIQMSNGQIVQEDIEECAVGSEVTMEDDVAPGEINIITRCFETPQDYAPRRESIIDKLNFIKMLGKNRKRKDQPSKSIDEDEEEPEPVVRHAASGVRRKSIAPAALTEIGGDSYLQDEASAATGLSASEALDVHAARYVTSGIRRGSVAAVSAAPPCRGNVQEKEVPNGPTLQPEAEEERMRYVTSGIRRGSVAAVSAAPPCRTADDDASSSLGVTEVNEFANQQRRGSYERIETYQIEPEDPSALRSGVRRRSLVPAADGALATSPVTTPVFTQPIYNPVANETIYTSGEDETDDEELVRKASSSSEENQFYPQKKTEKKVRKKGVMPLFESLTGRDAEVDYEAQDARIIEKNRREAQKKTSVESASIPQIMLSVDDSNYDDDIQEDGLPSTEKEQAAENNQTSMDEIVSTDDNRNSEQPSNKTKESVENIGENEKSDLEAGNLHEENNISEI